MHDAATIEVYHRYTVCLEVPIMTVSRIYRSPAQVASGNRNAKPGNYKQKGYQRDQLRFSRGYIGSCEEAGRGPAGRIYFFNASHLVVHGHYIASHDQDDGIIKTGKPKMLAAILWLLTNLTHFLTLAAARVEKLSLIHI